MNTSRISLKNKARLLLIVVYCISNCTPLSIRNSDIEAQNVHVGSLDLSEVHALPRGTGHSLCLTVLNARCGVDMLDS